MKIKTRFTNITCRAISRLTMVLFLAPGLLMAETADPDDIDVRHSAGKMYVHREGCPRLTTNRNELKEMDEMTLEEAREMGWQLCSDCPGVKTESGYTESWVNPPRDDVEKEKFKESRLAPLVSMGDDGKLVYKPYSSKGDRILDFSTCGYMRSEVPIPDVPVVKTLTPPEGKARSTDNMNYRVGPDSYQDVQAALDEAAAMKPDEHGLRGAVVLQKGTWYFSNTLHVTSGVVLRGEGDDEDGTVLIFTFPEGGDVAIQLGGAKPNSVPEYPKIAGTLSKQTGADGETRYILTLDDGYWFVVKDPKFKPELKLEPFVGSKVILTMKAVPATSDLKHNMPYEAQRVEDGQEIPPLNPHLKLPELPFGMANTAESLIADDHVPSGSSTLTLEDASGFAAGDSVTVYKTTNWEWIDQLGLGERIRHIRGGKQGASKTPWTPQTYTHPRKITAINGNTITLDVNLPQSIDQEFGGGYVRQTKPSIDHSQCGLENLRIVSNYDETKSGNGKGTNYANLWNGIRLLCRDGWTRNCTVMHVVKSAVDINGRFCTVREVKSLQPVGPKAGGRRYAFNLSDNGMGNLCYKCYSEDSRHDFVAGARVMGPNVFLKCTAYKGGQSEPHHRWSTGILYDNITMKEGGSLAAINRGDSGTGHGWAGANIVFWNCAAKGIVVFDPETAGENNFAIGYTGEEDRDFNTGNVKYANDRSGYWDTPREGVYYGYAAMGNGYIESPGEPVEPRSLFEQQLIDRIGKEKAEAVLK